MHLRVVDITGSQIGLVGVQQFIIISPPVDHPSTTCCYSAGLPELGSTCLCGVVGVLSHLTMQSGSVTASDKVGIGVGAAQ